MAPPRELEQTRRARGVVSDPQSGRRVDAARFEAPEGLAGVVDRFWTGAWDLVGQAPHDVQVLADPTVHLVFEGGRSRLVGVCRGLWRRRLEGRGQIRAIALVPGALRSLGLSDATTWTDRVLGLAEVHPDLAALEPHVLAPDTDEEGLALVMRWLTARVEGQRRSELVDLLDDMRADPALHRVEAVAAHAGVSVRSLQRRFRQEVGATPKWVLQRYRLQEAAARIESGNESLASVAYALGYADQAHLTRVFRAAVGVAPSAFRKRATR